MNRLIYKSFIDVKICTVHTTLLNQAFDRLDYSLLSMFFDTKNFGQIILHNHNELVSLANIHVILMTANSLLYLL